jgi:hypothetical protein
MEAGVVVRIKSQHEPIYDYLSRFFTIRTTSAVSPKVDVDMSHSEPYVRIGDINRILLYPKSIGEKSREYWHVKRQGILFQGLVPPHRELALERWKSNAKIVATNGGRVGKTRYWDETYINAMGKAEFGLCPDGGFPWSYRFVECCLLGVTPIVQTECDWYKGFYYHKWNDETLERRETEENFNKILKLITLPDSVIRANL